MAKVLVEETTSTAGTCKAQIWRRDEGLFHVQLFRWTHEVMRDQELVDSCWAELTTAGSITDSIDIARGLATELLARHGE